MNYSRAGNPKTLMQYFSRKLLRMMMMVVMLIMMMVMMTMMMVVMMTAFYVSHLFECYGVFFCSTRWQAFHWRCRHNCVMLRGLTTRENLYDMNATAHLCRSLKTRPLTPVQLIPQLLRSLMNSSHKLVALFW